MPPPSPLALQTLCKTTQISAERIFMGKKKPRQSSGKSSRRGATASNGSKSPWGSKPSRRAKSASKKAGTKAGAKTGSKASTRKSPAKRTPRRTATGEKRLQVVMADCGIGSRRDCETIIEEGRVEVDGDVVTKLGTRVDPAKHKIHVDGDLLKPERLQYFMLNKPTGVLSTSDDPSGRIRVIDLIKTNNRVYNVGRLDQSSEGLILVTNDGQLAHRLTHPRYGVEKKYHVQVAGKPEGHDLKTLEQGVYLAEGKAKAQSAKFIRKSKDSSWIEIVLTEGRNREIRRLLAKIGHKVRTLKRVSIGPLKLGDLPKGAHRRLTAAEVKALQKSSGKASPRKKSKSPSAAKAKGFDEFQEERTTRKSEGRKKRTFKTASTTSSRGGSAKPTRGRPAKGAKGARGAKSTRGAKGSKGRSTKSNSAKGTRGAGRTKAVGKKRRTR